MAEFLAQRGSDPSDWIQIVLILIVVGLSALGAVARKLIEVFSAKSKRGSSSVSPVPPGAERRPAPVGPRRRPVAPPVAMPLDGASAGGRVAPDKAEVELPQVLREMLQDLTGVPIETARARPKVVPPRPPGRPRPVPSSPPPAPTERPRRARPPATKRDRQDDAFTQVDDEERHFQAGLTQRMSHLESAFDAEGTGPSSADVVKPSGRSGWRPARGDLRRAIVMYEIFSPPMALRAPADEHI